MKSNVMMPLNNLVKMTSFLIQFVLLSNLILLCEGQLMEKQNIVDRHNEIRAGIPVNASNMEKMEWDDSLGSMAQEWAERCVYETGIPQRSNNPYKSPGQLMHISGESPISMLDAVKYWWDFQFAYKFDTHDCLIPGRCADVRQLLWSDASIIGCGMAFCPSIDIDGIVMENNTFMLCYYGPNGPVDDQNPYTLGDPCTNCNSGFGWCDNALCNDCKSQCEPCGVLNEPICHCNCFPGWTGNNCSDSTTGAAVESCAMTTTKPISTTVRPSTQCSTESAVTCRQVNALPNHTTSVAGFERRRPAGNHFEASTLTTSTPFTRPNYKYARQIICDIWTQTTVRLSADYCITYYFINVLTRHLNATLIKVNETLFSERTNDKMTRSEVGRHLNTRCKEVRSTQERNELIERTRKQRGIRSDGHNQDTSLREVQEILNEESTQEQPSGRESKERVGEIGIVSRPE
ncbi:hypothetical protein CAPTEDRAFT_196237 [Capitella teleta]|uniref:SCP domain-containing protein n=1 Tax=Capitella teleta TaxID=283909 RepID=R7T4T8_CAPTE|nr:hypothetical protein CAPTEDRAFT_196237 [Capitella teleta]|eukprot:ELT87988.1 hypothetical protein CAPTEDRAFT_196237 [Capitella teleta]